MTKVVSFSLSPYPSTFYSEEKFPLIEGGLIFNFLKQEIELFYHLTLPPSPSPSPLVPSPLLPTLSSSFPLRQTDLWKKTCFEFFWKEDSSTHSYFEANFSPSLAWNIFSFQNYRSSNNLSQHLKASVQWGASVHSFTLRSVLYGIKKPILWHATAILEYPKGPLYYSQRLVKESPPDFHLLDHFCP